MPDKVSESKPLSCPICDTIVGNEAFNAKLHEAYRAALVAVAKLAWEEGIDAPGSASDATAERIVDTFLAEQAGKDTE